MNRYTGDYLGGGGDTPRMSTTVSTSRQFSEIKKCNYEIIETFILLTSKTSTHYKH